MAAALALPGVLPLGSQAFAETVPEQGVLATKLLDYQDRQPGLKRTRVRAPSLYVLAPFRGEWALEASAVSDTVSGASPRFHTAISGASRQTEKRVAGDTTLTHYGARQTWHVGVAASDENDYRSRALSGGASWSSEDNNTTFSAAAAHTSDRIGSTSNPALSERRRTTQVSFGLAHNLSRADVVQATLVLGHGNGFFDDPYKVPDHRPDHRNQAAAVLRWNHHVEDLGATVRSGYRYYGDSFGIRAHTLDAEWVQPVGGRWRVTPGVRYHSQRAASFYFDPVYDAVLGAPFPPGWRPGGVASADQRLAGFGALGISLKVEFMLDKDWTLDAKYDRYEQRGRWRVGGSGSPGLAPFSARWMQVGLSRLF